MDLDGINYLLWVAFTVVGCDSMFLSLLTFDIAEHAQSNGGDGGM